MKKLTAMFLFIIMMFTTLTPVWAAGSSLDEFCGTYRGSYYANQGHTGLTLRVYKDDNAAYKAEFQFYSVPENPSVPSGLYLCDVSYNDQTGKYYVRGLEWINQPEGYIFVDLDGTVSEDYVYSGDVIYSGGSYSFELVKQINENQPSGWADVTIDQAITSGLIPLELQKDYQYQITRAEFCRLAMAALVLKTDKSIEELTANVAPLTFTDTNDRFVLAASSLGIVKGYGNGKFGPNDLITREQSAVMLTSIARLLGVMTPNGKAVQFADRAEFSSWSVNSIDFISAMNDLLTNMPVMQGSNNRFNPKGIYNNEQAFITIYKLYLAIPE